MHAGVKPSPSSSCLPHSAWHTVVPMTRKIPQLQVCAPLGSVTFALGSNPACPQCMDPQILSSTLNLLFLIFTPPSHNTPSSCCPRDCLHLAVCSSDPEEWDPLLLLWSPESTVENQANGGGLRPLWFFMHSENHLQRFGKSMFCPDRSHWNGPGILYRMLT